MKKRRFISKILLISFVFGIFGFVGEAEVIRASTKTPDVVVVLDPGHDAKHGGAEANGHKEHELVYKIAKYCKEELEKYSGVKVYMTRNSNGCPSGEKKSVDCNYWRLDYAKEVGADIMVSFHLNALEKGTGSGAIIYYPNSNYRPVIGAEGKSLASSILQELLAIGIPKFQAGITIRNSQDNSKYPDGSLADYLAIIKGAKLRDYPAALIEHAFLDNKSDVNKFLNTEEKLKSIGAADAKGIANYLGLSKENWIRQANDGNWYYYKEGKIDTTYTGLAKSTDKWMYVQNGKVDFSRNDLILYKDVWWYVENGVVDNTYDGVMSNAHGTWYIEDGRVDFSKNGLYQRGEDWYYFKGGAVDYGYTGLTNSNVGWWYVEKGKITYQYTGLTKYNNAWWYVEKSHLNFKYDGVASNSSGTWYIEDSKVDFNKNGLYQRGKDWYYFKGGAVDYGYTGLTNSNVGWWYVEKGKITYQYTGLTKYNNAWWYVEKSHLNFKYDGVASNSSGTWYIEDSKVDFSKNGLQLRAGVWYLFNGGAVSKIDSVEYYGGSWWYVNEGVVDFYYNGLGTNQYGTWYILYGKVDFTYNGTHIDQLGNEYQIINGRAYLVSPEREETNSHT